MKNKFTVSIFVKNFLKSMSILIAVKGDQSHRKKS